MAMASPAAQRVAGLKTQLCAAEATRPGEHSEGRTPLVPAEETGMLLPDKRPMRKLPVRVRSCVYEVGVGVGVGAYLPHVLALRPAQRQPR